ncbi:MAG: hypothetical protein V4660_01170 [Pseudomonadota bacterium]
MDKTIYVSSSDDLNSAILVANSQSPTASITIGLQSGFILTSPIPAINAQNVSVTIQSSTGQVVTLDGGNYCQGFIILNGSVTLQDILIKNMVMPARSVFTGNACMGAGAGLFVASTLNYPDSTNSYLPVVVLNNVSFSSNQALGAPADNNWASLGTNVFGGQAELGCFGVVGVLPSGPSNTGISGFGAGAGQDNGSAPGFGGDPSSGAGFGGGIFVMDNAHVTFAGSGSITANFAVGHSQSDGAGAGIFLQGSGTINFDIPDGETYTIADEVTDETGAVSADSIPVLEGTYGPDGLPTGGGTGLWILNKTGQGTLAIPNNNVHVSINVSQGILDLSGLTSFGSWLPGSANSLSIANGVTLAFNGYSQNEANQIYFSDQVTIVVDEAGFTPDTPVQVMRWQTPLGSIPTVNFPSGYTCVIGSNSITIVKKLSSEI